MIPTLITMVDSANKAYNSLKTALEGVQASTIAVNAALTAGAAAAGFLAFNVFGMIEGERELQKAMVAGTVSIEEYIATVSRSNDLLGQHEARLRDWAVPGCVKVDIAPLKQLLKKMAEAGLNVYQMGLRAMYLAGASVNEIQQALESLGYRFRSLRDQMRAVVEQTEGVVQSQEKLGYSLRGIGPSILTVASFYNQAMQGIKKTVEYATATIIESTENITKNVPQLIRKGLLGDAQNAIRDYVECAGGKHARMIEDISRDLDRLKGKEEDALTKINILTDQNLAQMYQQWKEAGGDLGSLADGLTVDQIQALDKLFTEYEGFFEQLNGLTAEQKSEELAYWQTYNEKIHQQITQLTEWLEELRKAYLAAAEAAQSLGVGEAGVPPPEFRGYQAGGIVTKPTLALVGEREPEIILPLRRFERLMPNVNVAITVNTGTVAGTISPMQLYRAVSDVLRDSLRRRERLVG
jgi:hypothetical protein